MEKENQDRQSSASAEKATIRISITSLLSFLVLAVAAIALAYIGGVMSGRQSCPVIENATIAGLPAEGEASALDDNRRILSATELDFARELRGENNRVARIGMSAEVKDPSRESKKAEKQPEVKAEHSPVAAAPKVEEKPQEAILVNANGSALYDHVLQLGAFRDENAVDKLRQKLEGYGLRTAMQKEGKVYLVLVRLRGTPERAAEIAQIAQSLGLGQPVQLSRHPVRE